MADGATDNSQSDQGQDEPLVHMFTPEGVHAQLPQSAVDDYITNHKFTRAVRMTSPEGQGAWLNRTDVPEYTAKGFKIGQPSAQDKPESTLHKLATVALTETLPSSPNYGTAGKLVDQFTPDSSTPGKVVSTLGNMAYDATIKPRVQSMEAALDPSKTKAQRAKAAYNATAIPGMEIANPVTEGPIAGNIEAAKKAAESADKGDITGVLQHSVNAAVPIAGPMAESVQAKAEAGDNAGAVTEGATDIAMLAQGAPETSPLRKLGAPLDVAADVAGKVIKAPITKAARMIPAEGNPNTVFHSYLDPYGDKLFNNGKIPMTPQFQSLLVRGLRLSPEGSAMADRIIAGKATLADADDVRWMANRMATQVYEGTRTPTPMAQAADNLAGQIRENLYPTLEKLHGLPDGALQQIKLLEGKLMKARAGKTIAQNVGSKIGGGVGALAGSSAGLPGEVVGYQVGKSLGKDIAGRGVGAVTKLRTKAISSELPPPQLPAKAQPALPAAPPAPVNPLTSPVRRVPGQVTPTVVNPTAPNAPMPNVPENLQYGKAQPRPVKGQGSNVRVGDWRSETSPRMVQWQHGAHGEDVPSILKNGITPRAQNEMEEPKAFVSTNKEYAKNYPTNPRGGRALIVGESPEGFLDTRGTKFTQEAHSTKPIPPEHIKEIRIHDDAGRLIKILDNKGREIQPSGKLTPKGKLPLSSAMEYLKNSGGDKNAARIAARNDGWQV